ncbi:hypothetical protein SDC9_69437 [bioreactor metagenome]|uniref:Uncharacterized protein n=1 Tax=bioreactor metagenome TaxID=1076179 RepID=A0A644Y378_9ZZZZ
MDEVAVQGDGNDQLADHLEHQDDKQQLLLEGKAESGECKSCRDRDQQISQRRKQGDFERVEQVRGNSAVSDDVQIVLCTPDFWKEFGRVAENLSFCLQREHDHPDDRSDEQQDDHGEQDIEEQDETFGCFLFHGLAPIGCRRCSRRARIGSRSLQCLG